MNEDGWEPIRSVRSVDPIFHEETISTFAYDWPIFIDVGSNLKFKHVGITQCGNFGICHSRRLYVKSILKNLEVSKLPFLNYWALHFIHFSPSTSGKFRTVLELVNWVK